MSNAVRHSVLTLKGDSRHMLFSVLICGLKRFMGFGCLFLSIAWVFGTCKIWVHLQVLRKEGKSKSRSLSASFSCKGYCACRHILYQNQDGKGTNLSCLSFEHPVQPSARNSWDLFSSGGSFHSCPPSPAFCFYPYWESNLSIPKTNTSIQIY